MAYPTYTATDLATFSGREVATYGNFAAQALLQATLLFKIGTCLADFPAPDANNGIDYELAKFGILSMADAIFLVQPFQTVLSSPFSSETIGSYSYSKVSTAVASGIPTGVTWFDIAVGKLSVCDDLTASIFSGGIEVFEHDGVLVAGAAEGNTRLVSASDTDGGGFADPSDYIDRPPTVLEETGYGEGGYGF